MKIASFLPSATEIVCALGRGDDLVAVSHECDHPAEARGKPRIVRPALDLDESAPAAIDEAVRRKARAGETLYEVDEAMLRELEPDLLLTQELCHVCAPSGTEVTKALAALPKRPETVFLTPGSLEGVLANVLELGERLGAAARARELAAGLQGRADAVRERVRGLPPVSVVVLEWTDPPFVPGHWVHEMVELAGGRDPLGSAGPSRRVGWDAVREADPEALVAAPCGRHLEGARRDAEALKNLPGWEDLRAVRAGRAFAVDADSFFARPGPRLWDGLEILAHLLHPDAFPRPAGGFALI